MDSVYVQDLQSQTVAHLEAWQAEGRELFRIARAAGVDMSRFETVSGPSGGGSVSTTRTRRRARRSTGGGGNGRARGAVSGEQILTYLREHGPANQSQLAGEFGVVRQTIARKLGELTEAGEITRTGTGTGSTWQARELVTA